MRKVVAIIQARSRSTRLPAKIWADINGRPMLWHVVNRTMQANNVAEIIVAMPENEKPPTGGLYYFGAEFDVLDRYYRAASLIEADIIVRITGDCPLIDPALIDSILQTFYSGPYDYVTNTLPPLTFPDGQDIEVFSFRALELAWQQATLPSHREHVTPFMRTNRFIKKAIRHDEDLSRFRLCVDEQADLDLVRVIYSELGDNPGWLDAVRLLKQRPDLVALNAHIKRNDGMEKSLREDANV